MSALDEAADLAREVEAVIADFRNYFPEPLPLPPNLTLAVRALALVEQAKAEQPEGLGTRWYAPAYRASNGYVGTLGSPTVSREHAEKETETLRAGEALLPGGNPGDIVLATRIEMPWTEVE